MPTPNILIIFADDLGVDTLRINFATKKVTAHVTGAADTGGPVSLPNLERLLKAGVHFTHAWAHPVCTPTRASLWTGMQAWKTTFGYPLNEENVALPSTTVTGTPIVSLAQALKAGPAPTYKCAMFGKWDLGTTKNPVQWGWDYFAGTYGGGLRGAGTDFYGFPGPPIRVRQADLEGKTTYIASNTALVAPVARRLANEYRFNRAFLDGNPDLRFYIWAKDTDDGTGNVLVKQSPVERKYLYATEDQIDDTQLWINQKKGQGPWCVALNLLTPHDPLHLPPPGTYNSANITTPANPSPQDLIVAMVESMDYYLGKLFAAIDDQLSNTVIIFMGDNGTQDIDPDTRIGLDDVLNDDKASSLVGSVQAPMIVADGGVMKGLAPCYLGGVVPRSETTQQVHIMDVYRTALSIAGVSSAAATDSISMAPVLKATAGPRRVYNFGQEYDLQQAVGPDGQRKTSGYNAQLGDGVNRLICRALVAGGRPGYFVNEQNIAAAGPVLSYQYTRLDPDGKVPGSFIDTPLPAVTRRGTGWVVRGVTYEAKVLAMYQALSLERADHLNTQFPPIIGVPLVAQWLMNEGTGTTLIDRSGHQYNRPFTTNVAQWVNDGVKSAKVLKFNGVAGINMGTAASLAGKTSFTVSAWIKTTATTVTTIIQQRNGGFNGEYKVSLTANGRVSFFVFGDNVQQFSIATTITVNDGQWHHIAAVRDGDNGYIYVDGDVTPAAQGSGTVRNLNANISVGIGGDIRDDSQFFDGTMFDVRIYRVALSAAEIAADLALPVIGSWSLDEMGGTVAFDKSLLRGNGTIQGPVKWNEPPRGLLLNGTSNYIALGKGPALAGKASFTVTAWIRTTGVNGVIVQQRNGGYNGQYQLHVTATGTVRFWLYGEGVSQFDITTTIKVNDGQWHHVTAMRDGNNGRIYIDGKPTPAAQGTGTARNLDSNISVAIGADIRDNVTFFAGIIREVRIHTAALNTALIAALATPKPQ